MQIFSQTSIREFLAVELRVLFEWGLIYLPLVKCYCIDFKHVFILLQYCLSCVTKLFIDINMVVV